mgnify:CR=1 FL=1
MTKLRFRRTVLMCCCVDPLYHVGVAGEDPDAVTSGSSLSALDIAFQSDENKCWLPVSVECQRLLTEASSKPPPKTEDATASQTSTAADPNKNALEDSDDASTEDFDKDDDDDASTEDFDKKDDDDDDDESTADME